MKIANIDTEFLHIFWTTWGNSMKFSGLFSIPGNSSPNSSSEFPPGLELEFGLGLGAIFRGVIFQGVNCPSTNLQLICKKYKQSEMKRLKTIWKEIAYYFFRLQKGRTIKRKASFGGFAVFKLLVVLSIKKLYSHDIPFEMLFFVEWKTHKFVFYLSCQTIFVIFEMVFSLWNIQGDYAMNSYINWLKLVLLYSYFYLGKHFHEKCFNRSKSCYS